MGYIGNQTTNAYTSMDKQDITGNGGANYTLSHAVANEQEIEVFVNNVRQEGGVGKAYTVSGTALTMTGNVSSSDEFYVVFQGKAVGTIVPPDASVSTAKLIDGNVTAAKLATTLDLSSKALTMPTGAVLQVKQTMLTAKSEISNTSYEDSDLTVNITPSSTSSKIMVNVSGYFGIHFFHANPFWRLRKDTTVISGNDSQAWPFIQYDVTRDALSVLPLVMNILDSPSSTSQLTYTLQGKTTNASYPIYLNRGHTNNVAVAQSTITVTEIAG